MSIDAIQFRAAMRCLAGHVCLITTLSADGARAGLTATAVCSVSADPPTLLACVNRNSASFRAIQASGIFVVNVLALESRHLADRFASPMPAEQKFADGVWVRGSTGAPVLQEALVSFDCRIASAVDVGTHGVLFGAIEAASPRTDRARPLLYAHGSYGEFAASDAAAARDLLWIPSWDSEPAG
ncbi:flavin reductase family protein [Cupriavidus taiwanensis]|uniref:flavin reductase family protein n=1 Tax=Cupriavidus taiwanensis TaxID=164546 RepID=UPI0015748E0D|nr:flavin reductase family protein [Cupriavidus taiwanensis]NSX14719.1 flavin reductase family protein [Cupriavidus taiwanensis]